MTDVRSPTSAGTDEPHSRGDEYHHRVAKVPTSAGIVMTILYVPVFRVFGATTWTRSALMALALTLSFFLVQTVMWKIRGTHRPTPEA